MPVEADFDESLTAAVHERESKVLCKTCLWLRDVPEPNQGKMRAAMASDVLGPVLLVALKKHGYPCSLESLRKHRTSGHA